MLPAPQVDPDITQNFDSTSLPLSSPFLGESGSYQVYEIGDDTGNYTVSYTPLVRGNYSVTVKQPALWEIQVVQTVVEATGEDLSGEFCYNLGFGGNPLGDSSGPFLPIPETEWVGRFNSISWMKYNGRSKRYGTGSRCCPGLTQNVYMFI